jgi:hypothetical protein
MTFKFLIDECLSPALRKIATARGHHESTCVRDRGWQGTPDHALMERVLAEDFTLVTNNSVDFRGAGSGSLSGLHSKTEIHAGLICLNAERGLDLDTQRALFAAALDLINESSFDLINKALELFLLEDGTLECSLYDLPAAAEESINGVITHTISLQPYLDLVAAGML